jgi:NAD(P)-dependent dehydrogenase (short-subunit alcohol dehydrogenase family)
MTGKQTLIVTGGGRGIGAAIARLAASSGYQVAINYRQDKESADALVADIKGLGGVAIAIAGDMANQDAVIRLFAETRKRFGSITYLVNNAGITGKSGRLDATDPETIRQCIDVNVTAAILVAREAVLHMSPKHGGEGGVIVNISSAAATIGSPGEYVWYAASKGAIDSFTLGLAKEVAQEGIRVVAVAPGLIDTEIHALSSGDAARVERIRPLIPVQRIGKPEEVAEAVLYLLSDKASYVTGTVLRVAGGR